MIASTTYLLSLTPTLSVIASFALANRKLRLPTGEYFVVLGAALALAHVILGAIIAELGLNAPALLHGFIVITLLLGAAAVCSIFFLVVCEGSYLTKSSFWPQVALFLVILSLYFAWSNLPAQAWDSLDAWLMQASRFTASQGAWKEGSAYFYDQRHPFTIPALAAASVWAASTEGVAGLTLLLWSIAGLSMALVCFGYARYRQIDSKIAAALAYAVLMTPLLENHYLLFGYADIWLAAIFVAALAVFDIGIRSQSGVSIIFGALLLLALLFLKNIGIVFAATLLLVVGVIFAVSKISLKMLVAYIAGICALAILSLEREPSKIESVFDVRLQGSYLDLSSKRCAAALNDKFYVNIVPKNPADLKPIVSKWVASKYPGRDVRVFTKDFSSVSFSGERCNFKIDLGDYDKQLIRVGQLSEKNHPNWMGILVPGADQYSIRAIGLSVQIGEIIVVSGIGRHMILELSSPAQVGRNFFHAHFMNSSYSLWTSLLLLSTWFYWFGHMQLSIRDAFPLLSAWALIGLLLSSQVFIIDFFNTSLPVNDSRYSRFILWLPAAVFLATIPLLRAEGVAGPQKGSSP